MLLFALSVVQTSQRPTKSQWQYVCRPLSYNSVPYYQTFTLFGFLPSISFKSTWLIWYCTMPASIYRYESPPFRIWRRCICTSFEFRQLLVWTFHFSRSILTTNETLCSLLYTLNKRLIRCRFSFSLSFYVYRTITSYLFNSNHF